MKKILFLIILLSIGCSKDGESNKGNIINPPEWLHGTWQQDAEYEALNVIKVEVSEDNMKLYLYDGLGVLDIAGQVRNMESAPNGSVNIEETTISEEVYEFTMEVFLESALVQSVTYRFERYEGYKIMFYQNSSGVELFKL